MDEAFKEGFDNQFVESSTAEEQEQQQQEEAPKKDKGYKLKENMTGKDFYQYQVDLCNAFDKDFEIKRPDLDDVKLLCPMCILQREETEEGFCCPEHCCDVSIHSFRQLNPLTFIVVGQLP